jgi:squalene-hopene/tetraprenyl-beta-curcumene cyclase
MTRLSFGLIIAFVASPALRAADAPTEQERKAVLAKAYDFLKSKQGEDGGYLPKFGPGVTALAASALVKAGYPSDDPMVKKALTFVEKYVKKDGGVYDRGLENYTTALAVVTFKECNKDGKYDKVIESAVKYLKGVQDATGTDEKDANFGGAGYNAKSRPDTSNTGFFVEALIAAGAGKDDPAIKKALVFLSRSQNLPGEFNDQPFAKKAAEEDKGGFVYNISDQANEKSEKRTSAGGLRSEGGMTYAGLKSFLYAGVSKDDPRVKAAVAWVKKHYTVTENPGMGQAGLYYYYHTFSKAMDALGDEVFEDSKMVKHPWKKELFEELKKNQKADGSWANTSKAFLEDAPELATAFAVLSLSYTKGK